MVRLPQHLVRFYPGLEHTVKTSNVDDISDPTDVVILYHSGCKYAIDPDDIELKSLLHAECEEDADNDEAEEKEEKETEGEAEAALILQSKLVGFDCELTTALLSEAEETPSDESCARVALVLMGS
eukprot:754606-Rhodomonas_salina.3